MTLILTVLMLWTWQHTPRSFFEIQSDKNILDSVKYQVLQAQVIFLNLAIKMIGIAVNCCILILIAQKYRICYVTILFFVFSGDDLQICPRGLTCCTTEMEGRLKSVSAKEYEKVADGAFKLIKSTFISRTKKFDGKWHFLCFFFLKKNIYLLWSMSCFYSVHIRLLELIS